MSVSPYLCFQLLIVAHVLEDANLHWRGRKEFQLTGRFRKDGLTKITARDLPDWQITEFTVPPSRSTPSLLS